MKKLFDKVSKQDCSHRKIVREILPSFAEKLKKEAVISSYDHHPFTISLVKGQAPIKIIPDLVIHLPNKEKILVEIANPRDPKRFLGEIVYPDLVGYHKKIACMRSLVKKARAILKEIEGINSPNFKPLKLPSPFFDDDNPDKLPESCRVRLIRSNMKNYKSLW